MNRYSIEEFHRDPALRRHLFSQARHERKRWLTSVIARLRQKLAPRPLGRDWLARLG